jgi:hypothetical protein
MDVKGLPKTLLIFTVYPFLLLIIILFSKLFEVPDNPNEEMPALPKALTEL